MFPLPNDINLIKYNEFKQYNIDIYNLEDNAFKEICYYNSKLKQDYPYYYRKNIIYSQKQFEGFNKICSYKEIDLENKMVVMKCKYSENGFGYKYTDNILEEKKTTSNIFKCFSSLFKKFNVGIIIFGLLLISIFIIFFLSKFYFKDINEGKILIDNTNKNENTIENIKEDINENEENNNNKIIETKERLDNMNPTLTNEGINITNENQKENDKISFNLTFKNIFLKTHPIFSICNRKPIIMSYLFFAFTIINYFGFNIIFYKDSLIEKRINRNDKDSFIYPLKKQIIKIILSIICSMVLTFLLKLIAWNKYENKLKQRRIIIGLLIVLITIFFLFCSSVFYYIYKNSEKSWIISGIICIILDWIFLSPIFILILSFITFKGLRFSEYIEELFPL